MNYSIWKNKISFTPLKIYDVKIDAVKLIKKYEEKDYSFTAANIELTAYDAEELRNDLLNGDEIFFTVRDDSGKYIFRGTFTSEGSSYDASEEKYTFSIVHVSKTIFEQMKENTGIVPLFSTINCPSNSLKQNIDSFASNNFNDTYHTRDYIFDLCRVLGLVIAVDDAYTITGEHGDIVKNTINLFNRKECAARMPKTGFDNFIADYSFEDKKADYDYVLLPIALYFTAYSYTNSQGTYTQVSNSPHYMLGYLLWNGKRATITLFNNRETSLVTQGLINSFGLLYSGNVQCTIVAMEYQYQVPDRTLDLRMEVFKNLNVAYANEYWKMTKVIYQGDSNNAQKISDYASEQKESLLDYSEISVLYNTLIDVDLLEKVAFQDQNIFVREIEDDLQWEDRTITGRIYKQAV